MKNDIECILEKINNFEPSDKKIRIMEVCGTHTMSISKHGLRQLIPDYIELISGPGCPVCVTSQGDIDRIIEIAEKFNATVFSFGDMMRVPGSYSSLYNEKSLGKKIKLCYSPMDALEYSVKNPREKVIFIAIGFETTIPISSVLVKKADELNLDNFFLYVTHKLIPPAMELLLLDKNIKIDGFLYPGHVSTIIGSRPYSFIANKYKTAGAIAGFSPLDIIEAIYLILKQINEKKPLVEIQYKSAVKEEGNIHAVKEIYDVFEISSSDWRGIGHIDGSGLKLKERFRKFDAAINFPVDIGIVREPPGCDCGDILKGIKKPFECRLFEKVCSPVNPVGPCMVSSEGSCAAYYKYERNRDGQR